MTTHLLERDRALDILADLLADTASGHGRTALISGEAGIGKSALVERFAEAQGETARFCWGRCEALFTPRPLGPLHDIAQQAPGRVRDLLDQEASRAALFPAFLEALADHPGPTVAVIEDVHWADEATLDLLKFLGRRVQQVPVLLIITYRDDEIGPDHPLWFVLGDLPSRTTRRLHLEPLSREGVATLARDAQRTDIGVTQLYSTTGGNPFFVTEALASDEGSVPESVRAAVLARAARLSPQGHAALELASTMPVQMEWRLFEAILPQYTGAVQECIRVGMLRPESDAVVFRHELARLAVESTLSPARLKELHTSVLRALLAEREQGDSGAQGDTPALIARLVHHAALAGDQAAVLQFAPIAAQQAAQQGAHREAASHYQTALRYAEALPPAQRAELLEGRAYECYLTNQLEDAVQAQDDALALWRAQGNGERVGGSLRWLSRLHWFLGDNTVAERYASEAIALLQAHPAGRELAMAYSNVAQLRMLGDDVVGAVRWGTQAIELASILGDDEIMSHALNNVGSAQYMAGDDEGRSRLEASLQLALAHGFEEHAARAYTNLASVAVKMRQYAHARAYLDDGICYTTDRDLDSWRLYMTGWRALARLEVGDWDGATNDVEQALVGYRVSPVVRIPATIVLGWIRLRRGDPGSGSLLDDAWALAVKTGEPQRMVPVAAARAEAAWLRGDLAACQMVAREGYELARRHLIVWDLGRLAYWLRKIGATLNHSIDFPEPYALEFAGDWRGAADAWARIGCPYEQALALAEGDALARREALTLLSDLGARATIERLQRQQLGGGRSENAQANARGPRPSTQRNPARLTNQQLEVLRLLAEGLRNAEIAETLQVSPKTVEHHVSAVLAKLNAQSRAQAIAQAQKLGVLASMKANMGDHVSAR